VAWLRIPETGKLRPRGGVAGAMAALPPFSTQLRLLAGRRGFVLVNLVAFVHVVARTGAMFNVIPVLRHHRLPPGPDPIGLALGVSSLAGLACAYPAGVLVDRFGRKAVIVPAPLVPGAALALFRWAPSYAWFLTACAVWSVAEGVSGAAPAAYAADVAPPR